VGEALEALVDVDPDTRIDELAYHWLAATQVADAAKAIGYARQAGDHSLANLAFEEAAAHYERALGVLQPRGRDDELLRCDLLIATADAQRRTGNPQHRETVGLAVELARRLGDAKRLALAALASARPGGWVANNSLVDEALVALYEEASAALGTTDSLLRARLLGQLATELVYTPHRARRNALSRQAFAIARRGDRSGLAQVMTLHLIAINDPFTLAERLALTAELASLAAELGSSELACNAAYHRAGALLESADIPGAEHVSATAVGCGTGWSHKIVRTRRGWAAMLLDRDAPGDRARATELIAAGRAEAEHLGMAREIVRFERLTQRLGSA